MYSYRYKLVSIAILTMDIILTIVAFFMTYFIRNSLFGKTFGYISYSIKYTLILVIAVVIIPITMSVFKIYGSVLRDRYKVIILKTTISILISVICISSILFLIGDRSLSRLFFGTFGCVELTVIILERIVFKVIINFYYKNCVHKKNVLIIGCSAVGKLYYEKICEHNQLDINIVGFVSLNNSQSNVVDNDIIIGTINDLGNIVKQYNVSEVIVALSTKEYENMENILSLCDREGLRVSILPAYYEYLKVNMRVENMFGIPIINIREVPLDSIGNRILKRIFDIVVSVLAIILLSPIYVLVALGVKLSSPGPILFKQERVGIGNKPFMMLKFRSMCVQNEEEEKTKWTTPNDSRVTRFGAFIRKTSLDELPQFFNVLKGDMSIIGPRPERPYWVEKFKKEVPNYMLRHYIKTGITGWAQVNGLRGDTSIEERINCDNFYIYNWSIWMDIKIIFMTVVETLIRKNAY